MTLNQTATRTLSDIAQSLAATCRSHLGNFATTLRIAQELRSGFRRSGTTTGDDVRRILENNGIDLDR